MSTTFKDALSLSDAAKLLPKFEGRRVHVSTVWRWARIGVKARNGRRIKLRHGRLGRRVVVTSESIEEFATAIAQADAEYFDGTQAHVRAVGANRTDREHQQAIERAERELRADGFGDQ